MNELSRLSPTKKKDMVEGERGIPSIEFAFVS